MKQLDEMIEETLSEEEQALLRERDDEPGYLRQAFGLFRGPLGWVMWFVYVAQLLLFLVAAYALWQLFTTADVVTALRWGFGAVLLVQIVTFLRGFMGVHFEANRVLRAVKRLELRLVQTQPAPPGRTP